VDVPVVSPERVTIIWSVCDSSSAYEDELNCNIEGCTPVPLSETLFVGLTGSLLAMSICPERDPAAPGVNVIGIEVEALGLTTIGVTAVVEKSPLSVPVNVILLIVSGPLPVFEMEIFCGLLETLTC
jgi:hypothetical protein